MNKNTKIGGQFSGVGAFDTALSRLDISFENVYQAEWDKYARKTYLANHEAPEYYVEDVNNTPTEEITRKHGSLDIIMFSPPCQAFSIAGKRKGEDDKRGILFYNSHEFIKVNNPRYFIFENVKGLLSDDSGKTFRRWVEYLGGKSINGNTTIFPHPAAVPYHIYYKVLNAKDYNIPQNRERVFIVGIRDDVDNYFTWPKELFLEKRLRDVLEEDVDEKYYLSDKIMKGFMKQKENFNGRFSPHDEGDISKCITARYHKMSATDTYIAVKSANSKGFEIAEIGEDSINFEQPNSNTRRGRVGHGVSQTINTSCMQGVIELKQVASLYENIRVRRLTPREVFRLMDFPDTFTWPVSDSQAYKQGGNSICVGLLAAIISKLNFLK